MCISRFLCFSIFPGYGTAIRVVPVVRAVTMFRALLGLLSLTAWGTTLCAAGVPAAALPVGGDGEVCNEPRRRSARLDRRLQPALLPPPGGEQAQRPEGHRLTHGQLSHPLTPSHPLSHPLTPSHTPSHTLSPSSPSHPLAASPSISPSSHPLSCPLSPSPSISPSLSPHSYPLSPPLPPSHLPLALSHSLLVSGRLFCAGKCKQASTL